MYLDLTSEDLPRNGFRFERYRILSSPKNSKDNGASSRGFEHSLFLQTTKALRTIIACSRLQSTQYLRHESDFRSSTMKDLHSNWDWAFTSDLSMSSSGYLCLDVALGPARYGKWQNGFELSVSDAVVGNSSLTEFAVPQFRERNYHIADPSARFHW